MKLIPTVATLTIKGELKTSKNGIPYMKCSFAVDNTFIWATIYSASATYIETYANVGASIFLEEWLVKQNKLDDKTYYDFNISRLKIIKNGGDK